MLKTLLALQLLAQPVGPLPPPSGASPIGSRIIPMVRPADEPRESWWCSSSTRRPRRSMW